tara:strand:- start:192 stop:389 length:198 start_codon:yes stop_codon:yes gene_type:complete
MRVHRHPFEPIMVVLEADSELMRWMPPPSGIRRISSGIKAAPIPADNFADVVAIITELVSVSIDI